MALNYNLPFFVGDVRSCFKHGKILSDARWERTKLADRGTKQRKEKETRNGTKIPHDSNVDVRTLLVQEPITLWAPGW